MIGGNRSEVGTRQRYARLTAWILIAVVVCGGALLTGWVLSVGAQTDASAAEAESLTVTARDAQGNLIQAGAVVLYDSDWTVVGEKQLDGDGTVRWSGVSAGEYHLELYRTKEEFWGSTDVTIDDGEQREVTIRRTEPRMTTLELVDADEDGTYRVGESVTVSPKVRNDRSFPRTVRVRLSLDTNGDTSPDTTVTRGPVEISGSGSQWYGYEFTPDESGAVAVRVIVESKIAGSWVATDRMEWSDPIQVATAQTSPTATMTAAETPSPTPTQSPTARPQQSTTSSQGLTFFGGFGREEYFGTGVVLAAVLASLYVASQMIGVQE